MMENKVFGKCASFLNGNECSGVGDGCIPANEFTNTSSVACLKRPRVIVALDWENILLSYKENRDFLFGWDETRTLDAYIHENYDIIVKTAYLDLSSSNGSRKILDSFGYTIVNVPSRIQETKDSKERSIKNAVDGELSLDVYAAVVDIKELEAVVLLSGDGDFLPLVKHIKKRGKDVVVIANKGHLNKRLRKFATCVFYIEDIIQEPELSIDLVVELCVQEEINTHLLEEIQEGNGGIPIPSALSYIYGCLGLKNLKEMGVRKSRDLIMRYPVMFKGLKIEKDKVIEATTNPLPHFVPGGEVLC